MLSPTVLEPAPDMALEETVQVTAFVSNPETPTPVSENAALLRVLGELALYRQEHGVAPGGALLNPLTALEVVLATHNWQHIFDPTDLSAIALFAVPGLPADAVQFVSVETVISFSAQC